MARKTTIYPLTSLRFFFALAVFLHHCNFLTKQDKYPAMADLYRDWLYEGYIGVSFFFILSGFILAYNYQDGILSGKRDRRSFFVARFARIYPLHLLTLLIALPVSLYEFRGSTLAMGLAKFFSNLTLTQSYIPSADFYSSFNAPSWSISTEAFFYLVFPALILVVGTWFKRFGRATYWSALLVLLIPVGMLLVPEVWQHAIFYIHPFTRLADFFLGILLFNLFREMCFQAKEWGGNVAELFALALLALTLFFHNQVAQVFRFSVYYWPAMLMVIGVFAFQRGWFSRLLSNRFLVLLGEISFAFYLIHKPVMYYYKRYKSKLIPIEDALVDMTVLFLISLAASYLIYTYFERPVGRWVKATGAANQASNIANPKSKS